MTFTYPSHTTKGCVPLSSDVTVCEDQIYNYIVDWKKRFDNKRSESEIREITRYLTYRNFINVDYSNGIDELYF